jgi:fumarate reductase subunit C
MSANPMQDRQYRPLISHFWWLHRRPYLVFVLRELSCVFVAWFVIYLLLLVDAVHAGNDSYQRFIQWAGGPWILGLNIIALVFVVMHSITWFNLAPKALVVRIGGRRLRPRSVAAAHYIAWAVASAVVAWIVLGGP